MKIIELFSGIGGFTKGFEDAGYTIEEHYFSEIDKHAIANYKYNYPNAKYIGSVTDIRPTDFRGIDIITFGSPCQDFSLAGKRKGLEGERSILIEYAIRAITDIRPSVFIWENVKGAFSSNSGADFWAILQAFANIGNYRLEWQLLNTKWFLPQNRERIYLIGHLADRSEPGVFPIGEEIGICNERNSEKPNQIASTLNANDEKSWVGNFIQVKSATKRGRVGKGVAQTLDCSCNQGVMIGAFRGINPENPKSRESGLPTEQMLEINKEGVSNTLTSVQKDNVVIQMNISKESGGKQPYQQNRIYDEKGIAPALLKEKSDLLIGTWRTHKDGNGFREIKDGNSPTIPARAREDGSGQPVIKIKSKNRRLNETIEKHNLKEGDDLCFIDSYNKTINKTETSTISTRIDASSASHLFDGYSIRRLTEIECERLQGFPDNWTEYGNYDGNIKKTPKTQRYKMLGNAVTVRVVEEIAKRLNLE